MKKEGVFEREYEKLNTEQKKAVDTINGPVMVVAGPGTGKTQILAMRIGNILRKTDIKGDGILCLTFTNSAVDAMRERLSRYIGEAASAVNISTFHSFGMKVVEEHYRVLGLAAAPKLLDEIDAIALFDEVLEKSSWQYLKPRGERSRYFKDMRSIFSLLKRERIISEYFLSKIEEDLEFVKNDPENISTRGESKGEMKKEAQNKIEGLGRTREVAKFFELYEDTKKLKNVFDYDDVLENLVKIMEKSKDAVADVRERYLYVLVDEHQDSSRVQNEFLKTVWGKVEQPDIFVVGDDRQLIYGFSGASIDHFKGFNKTWKNAKLITLVDNYRSTQVILDVSHALLQSVLTPEKLRSQSKENHPIRLIEADSREDEIVACAEDIKEKIKQGVDINDCAILVPKNSEVREALRILHEEGLPVSASDNLNLFDQEMAEGFIRVLKIITHQKDNVSFARSFLDSISGIPSMEAHKFLFSQKMREFSFQNFTGKPALFGGAPELWIKKLTELKKIAENEEIIPAMEKIGKSLFKKDGQKLVSAEEILTTLIGLAEKEKEKNPKLTLAQFVEILTKLESYGEDIPIVVNKKEGIKVLTLHGGKGLEFDFVWIAHMDEKGLNGGKRLPFTLPSAIEEKVWESDADRIKRKLYVAITRAKRFCALSYAGGEDKEAAQIIRDLPKEVFVKEKFTKNKNEKKGGEGILPEITKMTKLVSEKYKDRIVSASSLNNFFECAWKWYFRTFLGLPEETNEHLEFGSKVHSAIDQILKSEKIILPPDPEVARLVGAWAKARLKEIAAERENEYPISFRDPAFPHLNIYGRIDLIEKLPDGSLRITDFKTGQPKKKNEVSKRDEEGRLSSLARQLAMYAYLLKGSPKWEGVKVSESRLEFLEAKNTKENIFSHMVTPEEVELLIKDIEDYDKLVKSGEWKARECHYNSYGKNTECEYCKMSKIYK